MAVDLYMILNVAANVAAVAILLALFVSHISDKKLRRAHTEALQAQTEALKQLREATSIVNDEKTLIPRYEEIPPWKKPLTSTRGVTRRTRVKKMGSASAQPSGSEIIVE